MSQALEGLVIAPVVDDHDFEAMITVRLAARPGETPPRIENLRHHLANMSLRRRNPLAQAG